MRDPAIGYHGRMRSMVSMTTSSMLLGSLVLVGCRPALNQQNGLAGPEGELPALQAAPPSRLAAVVPEGEVVPLDRRNWTPDLVIITRSQVRHDPSYGSADPVVPELEAHSRSWPTTSTATETGALGGAEALNAALAPVVAAGNLVLFPIRAVQDPPWIPVRGGEDDEDFQLLPTTRRPLPWSWVETAPTGVKETADE